MSQIVTKLTITQETKKMSQLIFELHKLANFPVNEVQTKLNDNQIFKIYQLFYNDHEEVAAELKKLIKLSEMYNCNLQLYEFLYDEEIDKNNLKTHQIPKQTLLNILNEA